MSTLQVSLLLLLYPLNTSFVTSHLLPPLPLLPSPLFYNPPSPVISIHVRGYEAIHWSTETCQRPHPHKGMVSLRLQLSIAPQQGVGPEEHLPIYAGIWHLIMGRPGIGMPTTMSS